MKNIIKYLLPLLLIFSIAIPFISPTPAQAVDNPRYFVTGQVFIVNGSDTVAEAGRQATAGNTILNITDGGAPHQFVIWKANGTTATVISGTSVVSGSPVTLASGSNTITATGTGTATLNLTLGTGASWVTAPAGGVNSWSAASGGQCGASVPASTDSTYFDANSFTAANQILTADATAYCLNMDWTGATNTPTLTVVDNGLRIYGNATFIAAMVQSGVGAYISFRGTGKTLTTNTLSLSSPLLIYSGSLTLIDSLTDTTKIYFYAGEFNTGNQTITTPTMGDNLVATAKILTLGTSTINLSAVGGWSFSAGNLTLTDATHTINVSRTGAFAGGSPTGSYGTVNLNGTAHTVSGANTFVNLTRTGTATKTDTLTISGADQTITGTLCLAGNSSTNRLLVQTATLGTRRTFVLGGAAICKTGGTQNVDFMDIGMSGGAANERDLSAITGLSGDCGGNDGVTFTASAAQTSVSTDTWSTVGKWTSRVPLPQDDVTCSHNTTVDMPRIGRSITFTGTPTISLSNDIAIYGSITLASGISLSSMVTVELRGRSVGMPIGGWVITTNGKSFTRSIAMYAPTGTYIVADSLAWGAAIYGLYLYNGTFNDNGKATTGGRLYLTGAAVRGIVLSGTMVLTGTSSDIVNSTTITNLTATLTGSTIVLAQTGVGAQTFAGGGLVYNNVTVSGAGAYALTVSGNNSFNTFTVQQSVDSVAFTGSNTITSLVIDRTTSNKTITETAGTNQTITTVTCATSAARTLTINSTAGTATLTKSGGGTVWIDYISLANNTGAPANTWYYGSNNTIGANVNGWSATVGPTVITVAATGITAATANLNGEITATGGINSTVRGFGWGITSGFPYAHDWNEVGSYDISSFTTNSQTFPSGVTIYFQAYATNPAGTGYGIERSFLTLVGAPTNLTATYISDHEVSLTWAIAPNSVATQVRAAYGREPINITDGYLVYNGIGTSVSDFDAEIAGAEVIYYRAWAQRSDLTWGTLYDSANTEDMMSLSLLFIGIIILILVAAGMAIGTFITRRKLLGILSGFLFTAIAGGVFATPSFPLANLIIMFSAVMSIAMFTSPMYLTMEENKPELVVESQHDRISKRIEARRHKYDAFKPKPKEPWL